MSLAGTFTGALQISGQELVNPGDSVDYTFHPDTDFIGIVSVEKKTSTNVWSNVVTFTGTVATPIDADQTGTFLNDTSEPVFLRMTCTSFDVTSDNMDYAVDPVAGIIKEAVLHEGVIIDRNGTPLLIVKEDGIEIPNLTTSGGSSGGTDYTVDVTGDVGLESGDDFDIVVGADYTDDVTGNYTSDVAGDRTLSADGTTTISAGTAAESVILEAPFAASRIFINGGLTLVRATTAASASTSYQNILGVTSNASQRTVTLEADMNLAGRVVWIIDEDGTAGNAAAFPIIVTPESGTIDGFAGDIISSNFAGKAYYGDGTNWHTFAVIPGVKRLIINGYAKVGTDAGWVFGAASNVGRLATLPASQTGSDLVVPITGLPVGSTIIAFHLLGQVESAGGAVTLDADLRKLTMAAADLTDASVSTMTQISVVADTAITEANSLKTLATAELVGTDETFYMALAGTTAAATDIDLAGIVIHYR